MRHAGAALTLSTTLRSLAAAARVFPVLPWRPEVAPAAMFYAACALAGALLYALSWLAAPLWRHCPIGSMAASRIARSRYDLAAWTIAGAVFGAALGLFQQIETTLVSDSPWFVVVFGVSAVLIARNLGVISFVGLTSAASFSDEDREWFARADGWYTAAAITYFVASGLILFASNIVELVPKYGSEVLAAIGGISGLVTLLIGKSPLTAIDPNQTHRSQSGRNRAWALNIATPIFACSLLIAVSAVIDRVLLCMPFTASALWTGEAAHSGNFHPALILGIAAVLAAIVEIIAGFYIDINQFSLHALYRDRLVRCFLAASRHDRPYRNLFTDFDRFDNPRMHELLRAQRENGDTDLDKPWRPLHIINAALNVVSTHNLAWQQRKAESFTFSPLHAGSGSVANAGTGSRIGSYRPTEDYGRGIKLGTAMAISGAAVSPNMGYNSSPAVTFFMALFNVRLGWWLGNPGPAGARTFDLKGPRFATRPLIDETFGLTTDNHPYVYLSDGGHFDNLGLYEMVRRRCRFVVVVDAGHDPEFHFADLGNAVRKIWLDHRVRVTFRGLDELRPRVTLPTNQPLATPYHAIGQIHYAEADGAPAEDGWILYLKPSVRGSESVDVLSYAAVSGSFPHESTLDQWFTESQFESYRALGFEEMASVIEEARRRSPHPFASLQNLVGSLS